MIGEHGSAGTAGEGYRNDTEAHPWQPGGGAEDWGYALAPLCKRCKQTLEQRAASSLEEAQAAMGTPWMTDFRDIAESIPPAYTTFLGEQIIDQLRAAE